MPIENFKGYSCCELKMPAGDRIICFYYRNNAPRSSVEDGNRNVFRVNKKGEVIWQITRIDHPGTNWDHKHESARKKGREGCIEPFIAFVLRYPDGTSSMDDGNLPPDSQTWVPGCQVELANLGLGSQWFTLDVDSGVAVEITPKGRPW